MPPFVIVSAGGLLRVPGKRPGFLHNNNLVMEEICVFKKVFILCFILTSMTVKLFLLLIKCSLRKFLTWSSLFYRYFSNSISTDTYLSLGMVKECM